MTYLKKILFGLAILFLVVVVTSIAVAINGWVGVLVSAFLILGGILRISGRLTYPGLPGKFISSLVICWSLIMMIGSFAFVKQHYDLQLKALRASDPFAYLAEIKRSDKALFLSEAKVLLREASPEKYIDELKGMASDDLYMSELKEIFPAKYNEEMEVRRKFAEAEAEQRKVAAAAEVKELDKRRSEGSLEQRVQVLERLMLLAPNNNSYKKERDKVRSEIQAEESRRQIDDERKRLAKDYIDSTEKYVTLSSFSWWKSGFGSIMEANFSIKNQTIYNVKDIEIECTHSAPSGTIIDRNSRTIYEIIAPKGQRIFQKFNMGFIHNQVSSTSCRVTSAIALP